MKRVILVVILIGFLVVSCGGGNIDKVKNGVFSNYDNTITVGKALENNKLLKGGKWKAIEMDGREYVTYTVKLTNEQIQENIKERLSGNKWDYNYEKNPNHAIAYEFRKALQNYKVKSMSGEEAKKAVEIFNSKLDNFDKSQNNDIEPLIIIDEYEIIVSFIMNKDKTFNINMMEFYTKITIKCFNDFKVQYNIGNVENDQTILSWIYRGFNPNLF